MRILGLDLGPNSIGWTLLEESGDKGANQDSQIIDIGVRVFPEGVDNFDTAKEKSRNEDRRIARGMRRQTTRRLRRRKTLTQALIQTGLFPADETEQAELLQSDPYPLRARAVSEQLSPYELGRVLYHLAQRRGFLSNRKREQKDKEAQGMLAEISENEQQRIDNDSPTIGHWLADKYAKLDHTNRQENDWVRNRHLARAQYEAEFEAIWKKQSEFYPDLLTEELQYGKPSKRKYPPQEKDISPKPKYPVKPKARQKSSLLDSVGIYGLIFFQRKVYWPKSVIGICEYEPKEQRCPRADRRFQRFRLLSEVNNLRYIDPDTRTEAKLTDQQRTLLLEKLSQKDAMTFDQIRKALSFLESVRFNLERGKRPKLQGHITDYKLAKALGKSWHKRPEDEKNSIIEVLAEDSQYDDDEILRLAVNQWGLSEEEAEKLLAVDLPDKYANLSRKAIEKMLPYLEQGMPYIAGEGMVDGEPTDALHAAGYLRRDELQRRIFGLLPDPARTNDLPIDDLPNPVVRRTLVEVRKVVNAIIREYGRPDAVHIEMARDFKPRPTPGTEAYRKYQDHIKEMRARETQRDAARKRLEDAGIRPTRDAILKVVLWEQQNETCIYSGQSISWSQLNSSETDIDHILPRSRTLDDSQMNKIVCFRKANADKGNKTPFEWLASADPDKYDKICQQAAKLLKNGLMPYAKYRRFLLKELKLDDFINRQLSDTRYIASVTAEYLRCLFEQDHCVLGLKGQLTAELRWQWGLDTILSEIDDSPAWQQQSKLRPGEKNRADHRHHAIDALVVALTNRSRLQKLSKLIEKGGAEKHGEILPEPWPTLRQDAKEAVKEINVSRRAERRASGQLHEETFYGKTEQPDVWVARKPVDSLTANEIDHIRDQGIQKIIKRKLREVGIEFGRGKKIDTKKLKEVLTGLTMPSGVPIKKVRVLKNEKTIQPIRKGSDGEVFVKPGSTHHLTLFEWEEDGKTTREAVFVTMLEAVQRKRDHEPIIQRMHPDKPEARFVMSLSKGEIVLANVKGEETLLVYKTGASTREQFYFAEHTDARKSSDQKKFIFTSNTLDARKVTIDPLGRIRWAND